MSHHLHTRAPGAAVLALAAIAAGGPAAGAQPAAPGEVGPRTALSGYVVDDSGRGLPGAEVRVSGTARGATTGPGGTYRVEGLAPGAYLVAVRRPGYGAAAAVVAVVPDDITEHDVVLRPGAAALAPVLVTAPHLARAVGTREGFAWRRRTGQGAFFDRADLERLRPASVEDVLRRTTRVGVLRDGRPTSRRGPSTLPGRGEPARDAGPRDVRALAAAAGGPLTADRCDVVPVLVDGVRLSRFSPRDLDPSQLEAVEVYSGPSTLPAEFRRAGTACGAVVLWTR